jgi:hypothetical protein
VQANRKKGFRTSRPPKNGGIRWFFVTSSQELRSPEKNSKFKDRKTNSSLMTKTRPLEWYHSQADIIWLALEKDLRFPNVFFTQH